MAFFPSFQNDAGGFLEILKGYPEAVQKALGVEMSNITSLLGYYSFVLVYIVLIGSVQGCNLGLNILSKEERDKTAEFLLVKPVKRVRLAAAVASLLLFLTFFFNIFSELFTEVDFLKYLSPFSWFDPKYLLGLVDYPILLAVIGGATILLSIILSFVFYNKKDVEI